MYCVYQREPQLEPVACLSQIHEYANRMKIAVEFIGIDNRNRCYRMYLLRICSWKRNNDGDQIIFNKQTTIIIIPRLRDADLNISECHEWMKLNQIGPMSSLHWFGVSCNEIFEIWPKLNRNDRITKIYTIRCDR